MTREPGQAIKRSLKARTEQVGELSLLLGRHTCKADSRQIPQEWLLQSGGWPFLSNLPRRPAYTNKNEKIASRTRRELWISFPLTLVLILTREVNKSKSSDSQLLSVLPFLFFRVVGGRIDCLCGQTQTKQVSYTTLRNISACQGTFTFDPCWDM